MRYLITISYDGSKFCGFQRLKKEKSVQDSIEKVLTVINKKPVEIKGAGRTDSKVHAYAQKAHFDLDQNIEPANLKNAINKGLDKYIYIKDCQIVKDDFHARFNVLEKEYIYKINFGEYDPTLEDYTLQINYQLDFNKMKKASKLFLGKHDFKAFVSGEKENTISEIKSIKFVNYGDILYIMIKGKSFYRYMIRNIIGALLEVGKGKIDEKLIKELLNGNPNNIQLPTAYPGGLYLFDIKY